MPVEFIGTFQGFFDFLLKSFLLLAPMLLLGLFLSGLLHVFISKHLIVRWFRSDGLRSVSTSAALGVPIPLCSCSVVPVVAEMRKKGASRSACMSFLITAPETGADSILVTNAFFGWIPAITRPLVSFVTAVVAGLTCAGLIKNKSDSVDNPDPSLFEACAAGDDDCDTHKEHEPLVPYMDDCYVAPATFKQLIWDKVAQLRGKRGTGISTKLEETKSSNTEADSSLKDDAGIDSSSSVALETELSLGKVTRHILKYGFVEIGDDIFFALVLGLLIGAAIFVVLPADLMANDYARWLAYPVMILIGVPIYICASASTPIAAALVAKGISPGAALVFLMTGPATNTGTIAIIVSQFGSRFASIYVGIVIVVTMMLGILIDILILASGFSIVVNLDHSHIDTIQWLQFVSAGLLVAFMLWRFKEGAFVQGYRELSESFRPLWFKFRNRGT